MNTRILVKTITVENTPESGLDLGMGFDSLGMDVHGPCIANLPVEPGDKDEGEAATEYKLLLIESEQSLAQTLNVSAQVSMNMGIYRGSAKAKFVNSRNVNRFDIFAVGYVHCDGIHTSYTPQQIVKFQFTEDARGMLEAKKYEQFLRKYGDGIAYRYNKGGEFAFIIHIEIYSATDQKNIMAKVRAKAGAYSGAASFSNAVKEVTKNRNVSVWANVIGTTKFPAKDDLETYLDFAHNFPNLIYDPKNKANHHSFTIIPYDQLADFPSPEKPFPPYTKANAAVDDLAGYFSLYSKLIASIDKALTAPEEYGLDDAGCKQLRDLKIKLGGEGGTTGYLSDIKLAAAHDSKVPPPADDDIWTVDNYDGKGSAFPKPHILFQKVPDIIDGPKTAADLKKAGKRTDGEYTLYFEGLWNQPMQIYCYQMASSTPAEFITLHKPNSANWPANTSGGGYRKGHGYASGSTVTTNFQKLRVDPITLQVLTDDKTFASSSGSINLYDAKHKKTPVRKIKELPLGVAETCYEAKADKTAKQAHAVVNLEGTGFRIHDEVNWVKFGYNSDGSTNISETRETADIHGNGQAGGLMPVLKTNPNKRALYVSTKQKPSK